MANAIDYLDWRGDVPLSLDGFNEVDGLIVSKLTSLDFTDIVPADGGMPLADALAAYFERRGDKDVRLGVLLPAGTVTMAKKMLEAKRFEGMVIYDYINHIDDSNAEQFCALTASLPDGTRFVAFRGTDDTITAWREDFNMSAHDAVPAQMDAAAYLTRAGWRFDGRLRVGGHSKGGNLSVFAAMNAPEELQESLIDVFNFDGPGFRESVRALPGYQRIRGKIRMVVPQYAMVGVLLTNDADYEIIESSETGTSAHNGFTWQVLGTRFVRRDKFSLRTRVYTEAIRAWADKLDLQQRQDLINAVFDALESTGARTLTDLTEQRVRKALTAAQDLLSDEDERALFTESMELLARSYISSARKNLPIISRFQRRRGRDGDAENT